MSDESRHVIHLAGLVHDIGKIQVPFEILSKPGRLSPLEFELVKTHAATSGELLHGIDFPWPLAEIAEQHHERLDGSGYPFHHGNDSLDQGSRILAVSDVITALAEKRPYRPGMERSEALGIVRRMAGDGFLDGDIVETLVRDYDRIVGAAMVAQENAANEYAQRIQL